MNEVLASANKRIGLTAVVRSYLGSLFLVAVNQRGQATRLRMLALATRMFLKESLLALFPRGRRGQERFLGFRMRFPSYSTFRFLFQSVFLRRDYEFNCARPDPLIIDCGSNIGMSVLWFHWRYPAARIIAFEPDAQAFAFLSDNVRMNGLSDVELNRKAVGDRDERRSFFCDAADPASLGMSLTERLREYDDTTVRKTAVECVRLSQYVTGPVDILKLDVEGSELEVLSELQTAGKLKQIGEMFIEYHYNETNAENRLARLLTILEDAGYRYVIDSNRRPPYPRYRNRSFKLNIYAYARRSRSTCS